MSKLCGVCHLDGEPVSPTEEARVSAALNLPVYRDPLEYREPALLMGWAAGREAQRGRGLFQVSGRGICLWDGRLDNRPDLLRQSDLPGDSPDSAIALNMYLQGGVQGLREMVGDWSLSIWDGRRREMVLASDYAGVRPLYYYVDDNGLSWSSSLADLVRWTGICALDDAYVGSFLVLGSASAPTPYARIMAVPPGHAVSLAHGSTETRAFWSLPRDREIRYADDRDYEEQMLDLFREAVQVRIASGTPSSAELSGGLDSSSIVCMADRLRRKMPTQIPQFTTFSYTHENCPDEKYFREVEQVCGLSASHLELEDCPVVTADMAAATPTWWEPRFRELARRMAAMGSGVLMTGQLGDLIMGNTPEDFGQVSVWLSEKRFGKALREAYDWGRSMQVPLYPILWRSIRETYFSWAPPVSPHAYVGAITGSAEDSLAENFRRRLEVPRQQQQGEAYWKHAPAGKRLRMRAAGEMLYSRRLQAPEALQHLSYTHPYTHRPLLEFMLSIPPRIVLGPTQLRRLMRRAFAGLLPPMILQRKSKAAYTSTYLQALRPLAVTLLRNTGAIQLVERGYVDRQSLTGRLEKYTQGLDCNEGQLRNILLLEFWLRNRMAFHDTAPHDTSESSLPPSELAMS